MEAIGHKRWVIPEGYIPESSLSEEDRTLVSHEVACILNTGDDDAAITITVFFTDREPAGPFTLTLGARRTVHLRFNELEKPERLPIGTDFASVIESDVPIVVQHTRLDSRAAEISLMSTIAYPA
jgi:hypothetical protein